MPNPVPTSNPQAGTARLWVVVPVAILSFFYVVMLEYLLPLYFGALGDAAQAQGGYFPADIYSKLVKYQVTPWIIGPFLAGLLARRYGERAVWSTAQLGMVIIPVLLMICPQPTVIKIVALWSGLTGALMWIGGVSLIQMVPKGKKGLSNGLMMAAMGVGSLLGPLCGRAMLYRQELGAHFHNGDWSGLFRGLFSLTRMNTTIQVADFLPIFWLLAGSTLLCGILIGLWGQRPGRFAHDEHADWNRTLRDVGRLAQNPRFWALVLALCVLGGPIFQASNQFLPFRAEDLGLKSGAQDHGWIWLSLLRTFMWIPGGLAVGLLAGRRAPGIAAVIMLAVFSLSAVAIGGSWAAWQLFVCVACFEFVRQFMRWSHAGYLSEHMPDNLRATAIGCAICFSGLGSTVYAWATDFLFDPQTQSSQPFFIAAVLGLIGCSGLFIFDRFVQPIREPRPAASETTASETGESVTTSSSTEVRES